MCPAIQFIVRTTRKRALPDIFGGKQPYSADLIESTRARLIDEYGASKYDWQMLRSTCATYLTNAAGIFGAATAFMSARQIGHSVMVAERHYLGVHRGIPKDAHTLELAMQIEPHMREVVGRTSTQNTHNPQNAAVIALRAGEP
jgi:hypothetical protein